MLIKYDSDGIGIDSDSEMWWRLISDEREMNDSDISNGK
jgi:hypothetical protein